MLNRSESQMCTLRRRGTKWRRLIQNHISCNSKFLPSIPPFPSRPAPDPFLHSAEGISKLHSALHACPWNSPTLGACPKTHLKFSGGFQSKMEAHDRLANLGNLTVSHKNNRVITFEPLIYIWSVRIKGYVLDPMYKT